jgi:hypothetical protein
VPNSVVLSLSRYSRPPYRFSLALFVWVVQNIGLALPLPQYAPFLLLTVETVPPNAPPSPAQAPGAPK